MSTLQDKVSWVSFMYRYVVVMCMLVIVALPIVMGALSMAFLSMLSIISFCFLQFNMLVMF